MVKLKILSAAVSFLAALFIFPLNSAAFLQAAAPSAKISFTFDDGYASAYTQAVPILAKYGYSATSYAVTGCIGMVKTPNTCRADRWSSYMTWDQLTQLQNIYHWEIGSHTVSHPYLASTNAADGQPNLLTPAQINWELSQSKADLAAHGFDATAFAAPYGDYNNQVLAAIAKYYSSQRGFADTGYNDWPYSDYYLKVRPVQKGVSVAAAESYIDNAIANNRWLILVFHNIKPKPGDDKYSYSTANLETIAAYIKARNVPVVNISSGLLKSDENLLPNSSFDNGIADGWASSSPADISQDTLGNGGYPSYLNSAKLISSAPGASLFSPLIRVDPSVKYALKNYLNVQANSGGGVGFYVDEYDPFGQWISGQYKATEMNSFVEEMNFIYQPTSRRVTMARLQIILPSSPGTIAFLDNSQWFAITPAASQPPPELSLLSNYTFDSGFSGGWRTDKPTFITADSGNNGSPDNPVNSIKLMSDTSNSHLFSPAITVAAGQSYSLNLFVNMKQIFSGELGFYIDEYGANGSWISGQYKGGVRSVGAGNVSFQYTPSSSSVTAASLQVIVVANSNIAAYFDNAIWQQN